MNILGRVYRRFDRAVTLLTACLFAFLALYTARNIFSHRAGILPALTAMVFAVQLGLFIVALFKAIDRAGSGRTAAQRGVAIALHALIAAVLLWFLYTFRNTRPITDAFDDIETAWYFHKHGVVDRDFAHAKFIATYGNNYFLILLLARCFRLMEALGAKNMLFPLYCANAAAIMLSIHLTWRFVRDARGIRAANQTLVLCALNPLNYCLVCWAYSLTLCWPISIGILCLGLRLYRCNRAGRSALLAAAIGLLVALGFLLRPTSVIVAIALGIIALGRPPLRAQWRRFAPACVAMLLCCALALAGAQLAIRRTFHAFIPDNFPVTYWLSMGSHDSGNLSANGEDWDLAYAIEDSEARSAALARQVVDNYKKLGPVGAFKLWMRKTAITWANGYSGLDNRLRCGEAGEPLYEYIVGSRSDPFWYGCQAYRLVCCLGIAALGWILLRRNETRRGLFACLLTLFGGLLFYMLWEAKSTYSASFLPFMLICAQEGISGAVDAARGHRVPAPARRASGVALAALGLAACCAVPLLCARPSHYVDTRVNTLSNTRVNRPIDADTRISQSFVVRRPFNRLVIDCTPDEASAKHASYRLSITPQGQDAPCFSQVVEAGQIEENLLTLRADALPAGGYRLDIERLDPEGGALFFYTKPTYLIDFYPGELSSDTRSSFPCDLMMNVEYAAEAPWCAGGKAVALAAVYLAFAAAGVLPFFVRRESR